MNQVNYNDLRTLWWCVRLQNFTAAARAIGRTESTVSTAMKRLSKQTGRQLFVQRSRGGKQPMTPTAEARRLAQLIEPVLRALESARSPIPPQLTKPTPKTQPASTPQRSGAISGEGPIRHTAVRHTHCEK